MVVGLCVMWSTTIFGPSKHLGVEEMVDDFPVSQVMTVFSRISHQDVPLVMNQHVSVLVHNVHCSRPEEANSYILTQFKTTLKSGCKQTYFSEVA